MKTLLAILAVLMFSVSCYAEECKVTLKDTDTYEDISVILNCLSSKIEALEKEVKALKKSGATSSNQTKTSSLLDNKYISVYDCVLSRDSKGVHLGFVVLNKSNNDILLATLVHSPIITDKKAQSFSDPIVTGMRVAYADNTSKNDYTLLNPGVPVPVSFHFNNAEKFSGDDASFRVGFIHLVNDKVEQYSVGRSHVSLEN